MTNRRSNHRRYRAILRTRCGMQICPHLFTNADIDRDGLVSWHDRFPWFEEMSTIIVEETAGAIQRTPSVP
jgi:hypothetical protein